MPSRAPSFRPSYQPDAAERERRYDAERNAKPWRQWYRTSRWLDIRANQLRRFPHCSMCLDAGNRVQASVCDHVTPHRGDPILFWFGPFQSLCAHHHNSAKQRIERAKGYAPSDI